MILKSYILRYSHIISINLKIKNDRVLKDDGIYGVFGELVWNVEDGVKGTQFKNSTYSLSFNL